MAEKKQKIKVKKDRKIEKIKGRIMRKRKPVFRGRFGNRKARRKTNEKWDKWRKPRGMDLKRHKQDGYAPDSGYMNPKEIRYVHPCGLREIRVSNMKDVENADKGFALRIASTIGRKKRTEILKRAEEKGLRVLNG